MRRRIWITGVLSMLVGVLAWGGMDASLPLGFSHAHAQTDVQVVKQFEETTYYLRDVQLVTPEVGWAVGLAHWDQQTKQYASTIVKTTDAGATWVLQPVAADADLNAVHFLDEQQGWVVGAAGVILHTADGGQSWQPQTADTTAEFTDVIFADAANGWAVTILPTTYDDFLQFYTDWDAALWHTADGGMSWQRQTLPEDASILHGVDFTDAQNGWAVGGKRAGEDVFGDPEHAAVVYHTADGGETWAEQYSLGDVTLTAVDFVDAQNGWAVGFPTSSSMEGGFVFHTQDGGVSWERQTPGGFFDPLWAVQFLDNQRGYVVGANYVAAWGPPVWRTFDGGATWDKIRMAEHDNDGLYGLTIVGDHVLAVGDHDFVCNSAAGWDTAGYDNEEVFTQWYLNPHYRFEDVFFVDETYGWAVGRRTYMPSHWGQVILATDDGGESWVVQYEHAPPENALFSVHRLNGVYFADRLHGWAVGRSESYLDGSGRDYQGAVLTTVDGGQSWQAVEQAFYADRDRELYDVQFLDQQEGWALATSFFPSSDIYLVHTTDGGQSWTWMDTKIEGTVEIGFEFVQGEVAFVDAQQGWAVGGQGQIVHTTDGGQTWEQQVLSCGYPTCPWATHAVAFLNAQQGWIAGEGLYHTTDGGQSWLPAELDETAGYLEDIAFYDEQTGWTAGGSGVLWRTQDGGTSWERVESGTQSDLFGLHIISADEGWLVGNSGVILHITSGG